MFRSKFGSSTVRDLIRARVPKEVGVVFGAKSYCTDGKNIYLADVPDTEEEWIRRMCEVLGYHEAEHVRVQLELNKDPNWFGRRKTPATPHDTYTKILKKVDPKYHKVAKNVQNQIEDIRIDAQVNDRSPGTTDKYQQMIQNLWDYKIEETWDQRDPISKVLGMLYLKARSRYFVEHYSKELNIKFSKNDEKMFNETLAPLLDEIKEGMTFDEGVALGYKATDIITDYFDPPPQEEDSDESHENEDQGSQDSSDSGEGDPSSGSDGNEEEDSSGSSEGEKNDDEKDSDSSDGGSESDNSEEGTEDSSNDGDEEQDPSGEEDGGGNDQQSDSDSDSQQSEGDSEGEEGSSSSESSDDEKTSDASDSTGDGESDSASEGDPSSSSDSTDDSGKEQAPKYDGDVADPLGAHGDFEGMDDLARDIINSESKDFYCKHPKTPNVHIKATRNFEEGAELTKDGNAYFAGTQSQLRKLLADERAPKIKRRLTKGSKLDSRNLHKIQNMKFGRMPEIWKEKKRGLKIDTAISILMDQSGSMDYKGKWDTCVRIVPALTKILDSASVKYSTMGYFCDKERSLVKERPTQSTSETTLIRYNSWGERLNPNVLPPVMKQIGSGYTPTADAILQGLQELAERKEARKILICLTDGEPCQGDGWNGGATKASILTTSEQLEIARSCGVKVFGFGIEVETSDWSEELGYSSVDALMESMFADNWINLPRFSSDASKHATTIMKKLTEAFR